PISRRSGPPADVPLGYFFAGLAGAALASLAGAAAAPLPPAAGAGAAPGAALAGAAAAPSGVTAPSTATTSSFSGAISEMTASRPPVVAITPPGSLMSETWSTSPISSDDTSSSSLIGMSD